MWLFCFRGAVCPYWLRGFFGSSMQVIERQIAERIQGLIHALQTFVDIKVVPQARLQQRTAAKVEKKSTATPVLTLSEPARMFPCRSNRSRSPSRGCPCRQSWTTCLKLCVSPYHRSRNRLMKGSWCSRSSGCRCASATDQRGTRGGNAACTFGAFPRTSCRVSACAFGVQGRTLCGADCDALVPQISKCACKNDMVISPVPRIVREIVDGVQIIPQGPVCSCVQVDSAGSGVGTRHGADRRCDRFPRHETAEVAMVTREIRRSSGSPSTLCTGKVFTYDMLHQRGDLAVAGKFESHDEDCGRIST